MDDLDCFEKLLAIANPENDPDFVKQKLYDVWWSEGSKTHNWKNYVPDEVKESWQNLSVLGMLSVYIMANKQADAEDWD
jgi:hypothetical protein